MFAKGSKDWHWVVRNLVKSKKKSNRDILCSLCWEVLKYDESIQHKKEFPEHIKYFITAKDYTSEKKIIAIAKQNNKY